MKIPKILVDLVSYILKYKVYALLALLIVTLFVHVLSLSKRPTKALYQKEKTKIQQLNEQIQALNLIHHTQDSVISYQLKVQHEVEVKIDSVNKQITKTRIQHGKKINSVRSFNNDPNKLNSFFTERYK
jgi:hypothetical protein